MALSKYMYIAVVLQESIVCVQSLYGESGEAVVSGNVVVSACSNCGKRVRLLRKYMSIMLSCAEETLMT